MKFADGEITVHEGGGVTIDGRTGVSIYRLLTLKQALLLDAKGIKMTRGASALQIARQIAGIDFPRSARGRDIALAWCESEIERLKGTAID